MLAVHEVLVCKVCRHGHGLDLGLTPVHSQRAEKPSGTWTPISRHNVDPFRPLRGFRLRVRLDGHRKRVTRDRREMLQQFTGIQVSRNCGLRNRTRLWPLHSNSPSRCDPQGTCTSSSSLSCMLPLSLVHQFVRSSKRHQVVAAVALAVD